jgi:hypothetical protein
MTDTTKCVPAAEADDPVAVVDALEVAGTLWEKGERADAIRWVRRAAEAAADAGNTARLAALARSAADLCAVDRVSAADLEEWLVPAQADPPPEPRPPSPSVPAPRRPTALPAVPTKPRQSVPPPVPSRPPRAPSKAPPLPPPVVPSPPLEPVSAARSLERSRTAESGQAGLRVSVRASVREPGLFVVRLLAEGEAPPAGTREGVLVMPEVVGETAGAKGSVA